MLARPFVLLSVLLLATACASGKREASGSQPAFSLPLSGKLTSGFGERLSGSSQKLRMHTGLDIAQKRDTPVKASAPGIVRSIGQQRGYGKTIVIDHGNGWTSLYAHLSGYAVKMNQRVRRDEIIGAVGSTGNATGPHLHFEIRRAGVPVDPARWVGFTGG